MKILIVTPYLDRLGGVANHYLGLKEHWALDVDYSFYGKKKDNASKIKVMLKYPIDILRYLWKLLVRRPDVVIVNPSLRKFQIIRDGIYLMIASLLEINVVTFIHGFDLELSERLSARRGLFQKVYNKSAFIYVLSSDFKHRLERAGINAPILLTTTKVSDSLMHGYDYVPKRKVETLVFVARVIKDKGIYEVLDALKILHAKYPFIKLEIAGDGEELSNAKEYVKRHGIAGVDFLGKISGERLAHCYAHGDVFVLPTRSEGMATCILEAMAFGLPIISAPVGGIVDFFINGENGFLLESYDPKQYADAIVELVDNPERLSYMSEINYKYAKKNFMASSVAGRIQDDIVQYIGAKAE